MANEEHLAILEQGVEIWNRWREVHPEITPDFCRASLHRAKLFGVNLREAYLSGADLRGAYLSAGNLSSALLSMADLRAAHLTGATLRGANLSGADLRGADLQGASFRRAQLRVANLSEVNCSRVELSEADFSGADLHGAHLREADLRDARLYMSNLSLADLRGADLSGADLSAADLTWANLCEANLERTCLVRTNLERANLKGCHVFGASAWELRLEGAVQTDLIITADDQTVGTADNLEVAQFLYLLLNNAKIRDVIDTVTAKVVLILGRFTPERKTILDAIRDQVRASGYVPIQFDFLPPSTRDLTETITTLARLSRFIIADLTEPRSIPHELESIVPDLPSVPVQPIMALSGDKEYGMFEHIRRFDSVLEIHRYRDLADLQASLHDKVIAPAEAKVKELRTGRDRQP